MTEVLAATNMLIGKALSKSFGENRVLDGVGVSVQPGRITALIGPSGGGKSTLLKVLAFLVPPDKGVVSIDDREYSFPMAVDTEPAPPWPKLTIVFQELYLWPHLTIRQNINLPLKDSRPPEVDRRVAELVGLFGIGEYIDRYPNQVSLGQRQRAAIVRAQALDPDYLLLDEITSALDVEHVAVLLELLKTLRDQGTGILLATHLIGFAKRAADRVVFLEHGKIVEEGGPDMLHSPKTERLEKFLSLVDTAS